MKPVTLVNLLDDFGLGGVTRGLSVFDSDAVRRVATSRVVAIDPRQIRAPHLPDDVIVIHFPPNWRRLAFLAGLRRRNPHAHIILVEHSYTGAWEALNVRKKRRFRLMLRTACRMVDAVVCVSNGQAQWLRDTVGVPARHITVIHPFSGKLPFDAVPTPDFADVRTPGRPLRIGAYGRFCAQKGFDTLLNGFHKGWFDGCELILGGFGPDEEMLTALAARCRNVRLYGKVTDIPAFLAECDVVALPSRWEAYGQVANEAREAGRPIIVAPVDGLPEQTGAAGFVVDFNDGYAVRHALADLTPEWLAAMSIAGREATRGCGEHRGKQWASLIERHTRDTQAVREEPAAKAMQLSPAH